MALISPNWSGKTTLLHVAIGRLAPEAGTVRHLPDKETVCLDQHGAALDPARSVLEYFRAYHPGMATTAVRYALARSSSRMKRRSRWW